MNSNRNRVKCARDGHKKRERPLSALSRAFELNRLAIKSAFYPIFCSEARVIWLAASAQSRSGRKCAKLRARMTNPSATEHHIEIILGVNVAKA